MTDTNLLKRKKSQKNIFFIYINLIINYILNFIQKFIIFLKKINPFNVPKNYKSPYQNKDTQLDVRKIKKGKKHIMGVPLNYKARIFSQIFHQANTIRNEFKQEKKLMEKEKRERERRNNRIENEEDSNNSIDDDDIDNNNDFYMDEEDDFNNNIITNKHPHDE